MANPREVIRMALFERNSVILIAEAVLGNEPRVGWADGPLPWLIPRAGSGSGSGSGSELRATREVRAPYFAARVSGAIYGHPSGGRRLWRHAPPDFPSPTGIRVEGLELLAFGGPDETNALLVLHGSLVGSDPIMDLFTASRFTPDQDPDWAIVALDGAGTLSSTTRRATTLVFAAPANLAAPPPGADRLSGWSPLDQWLWELASATPYKRYPPDADARAREKLVGKQLYLSRDWRALVLRNGLAFVATRHSPSTDAFLDSADTNFRSIYLDAILLGYVQRVSLSSLANRVAELDDPVDQPTLVRHIERDLTRFRNVYWHQAISPSHVATGLLDAYLDEHYLQVFASELYEEVSEYSRQVQAAAAERTTVLLSIITVVGLPFGLALGLLQALDVHAWLAVVVGMCAAGLLSVLLLLPLRRDRPSHSKRRP